jgi:hypothetical protein
MTKTQKTKGGVHTVAKIIKAVMSSAAEAELGGLFINAKTPVPMRKTLEEAVSIKIKSQSDELAIPPLRHLGPSIQFLGRRSTW